MPKSKVETKFIAVFDTKNVLVGRKEVSMDTPGIDPGDLKCNGTYKYDKKLEQFIPLGHGFGKVARRQPHSNEFVLAVLIEAQIKANPTVVPLEAKEWLDWYNSELRIRHEELSARQTRG